MTDPNEERQIVITRLINAPRELVFEAFTDPRHIAEWWGPNGFTNTIHSMDVRPGGEWKFIMHGPDGVDYPNRIVYHEITKPERLVYSHVSDDLNAPVFFDTIVTFEKQGQKTFLTMRATFKTKKERDDNVEKYGAVEGGKQTLARLAAFLEKQEN